MNEILQTKKVIDLLSLWAHKINLSSAVDFYDINKVAENLAANLLNELYGYQLKNLNTEQRNFPAVDLGCDVQKIAFQITSTQEPAKIESTLRKFVKYDLQSRFTDGVRFLFLTTDKLVKLTDGNKKKYQEIYNGFDEKHLLTLQDLVQETQVLYNRDNEKFCRVLKILKRELSPQSNNDGIPLEQLIELAKKLGIAEKERDDWMQKYRDLEMQLASRHDDVAKQAKELLDEGKLEEAKNLFKQSFANKLTLLKEAAAEAFSIAQIANLQYNTTEAINYYQQGLKLDPDNADGWNELGHLLIRTGELNKAIDAYQKVWELGKLQKNNKLIAMACNNLGVTYSKLSELDKAVDFLFKALKINVTLKHRESVAEGYVNIGLIYLDIEKLDDAINYFYKALEIDEALNNKKGVADDYSNLGLCYLIMNKPVEAIEYCEKALRVYEKLGHQQGMANNYSNLGRIFLSDMKLDKAIEFYNKSLNINEKLLHKENITINCEGLGGAYAERNDKLKAKKYWLRSIELYKDIGNPNAKKVQIWLDALQ